MKTSTIERTLWTIAAVATLAAGIEWTRPLPSATLKALAAVPTLARPQILDPGQLDSAQHDAINRNPFRLARRPASVAFGVEPAVPSAAAMVSPPRPAKPQLRLRGIIGPPWEAILDGVPQRSSGVVVRNGDVLADLQVRRVTRDSVVVADADTVWILRLERPWR
jgi:hypothetical protein